MCGIAGLFAKSPEIESSLGAYAASMLEQLADRGPDSSGIALYRNPVDEETIKLSLFAETGQDWASLTRRLGETFGSSTLPYDHGDHAVVHVEGNAGDVRAWIAEHAPNIAVIASGRSIELHKRVGRPTSLIDACGLRELGGTHAVGHTRMATESRVTTAGSHPFSTGEDLCLVHNGSLSNHNRLRRELRRRGVSFQTENDSEVAAGYLTWRLSEGDALEEALIRSLHDLDGFFTLAVGTRDGFAVLRDPIACKPAVMAETDDWVAMGSEYRALAVLPGAEEARVWEPEPGRVYFYTREQVAA